MRCYLNGCAKGYGGFLYAGDGVPRDCTAFCTPVETYLIDPEGTGDGTLVDGADPVGLEPNDCAATRIGAAGHHCHMFQSFFVDENGAYLEYINGAYGFCAPRGEDYGDCRQFSEEWVLAQYNVYIEDMGGTPEGWGEYIAAQCDGNLGCTGGCALVETLDALDTAFCEGPGLNSAACADGAKGAKIARRSIEKIWAERLIKAGMSVQKQH